MPKWSMRLWGWLPLQQWVLHNYNNNYHDNRLVWISENGYEPVIATRAMLLRIHAVHVDDAHMRIHAHWCACENLDAHQPHTKAKKTTIPHLISPSIYAIMHVLELDLAVESTSHQYEWGNELSNQQLVQLKINFRDYCRNLQQNSKWWANCYWY